MDPNPTTTTTVAPKPKPKPTTTAGQTSTATAPPKKPSSVINSNSASSSISATTATISPTASPDASSSGGLPVGAIAGIAAGGALILMFILSIFVCKKRRVRQYAARPSGHDPSRDPIDPNEVLPPENKYDQRTPTLAHNSAIAGALGSNRSGNSRDNDSGFISYPLALRGVSEDKAREMARHQDPRTEQTQQALQQEYSHYEDHIQSHYAPESPDMKPASLRPGPDPASPTTGGLSQNRAHPLPTPISTNNPSIDLSRNSPAPMSPSQRGFQQQQQQQQQYRQEPSPLSPRSRPQQQHQQQQGAYPLSPTSPRGQGAVIVNDMGNEFVIQSSNNSRRDSFDQEGSVVQSELSYRRGLPPRKSQESNLAGSGSQYPAAGIPSPMSLGPQRGGPGGRPGQGPPSGPGSNSTFSSPRQGPSGYPSPPVHPSQYPSSQHQYQPPPLGHQQQQQQQPYQQYPLDQMNGYTSPPMRPQQQQQQQQRPGYPPGPGYIGPGNAMRSPPMSPSSRGGPGGYSPHTGPSYPQQQQQSPYQQQQSNYTQQQQSPNYRPRNNNY
ncbi:hypothetical protein BGX29_006104 [Mortierella sp. GBA35]|nr:hypothetical protein BGX29_006104 [Mortierella sp. GBA35]